MKHLAALIGGLIFCLVLPISADSPRATVDIPFRWLEQGDIGVVTVHGENIVRVRAAFLDNQFLFVANPDGEFIGLIGVPMDAERTFHRLSILIFYADGTQEYVWDTIQVRRGAFARTTLYLPTDLNTLLDEDVIFEEATLLKNTIKTLTEGGNWLETGLTPPFASSISDGFGTIRYFNGDNEQRHNGIDFPKAVGTPVIAAADGVVILSQVLPIRGEYILISHGAGLYSGYAHLSERLVAVGDSVTQGAVIGSVGNTGRSTGAHLHWETGLGGVWVNPLTLTNLLLN